MTARHIVLLITVFCDVTSGQYYQRPVQYYPQYTTPVPVKQYVPVQLQVLPPVPNTSQQYLFKQTALQQYQPQHIAVRQYKAVQVQRPAVQYQPRQTAVQQYRPVQSVVQQYHPVHLPVQYHLIQAPVQQYQYPVSYPGTVRTGTSRGRMYSPDQNGPPPGLIQRRANTREVRRRLAARRRRYLQQQRRRRYLKSRTGRNRDDLFSEYEGFSIRGGTPLKGKFRSAVGCKRACANRGSCMAADYVRKRRKCYIHTSSTSCDVMSTSSNSIHFQRAPCDKSEGEDGHGVFSGKFKPGGVHITAIGSLQGCIKQCTQSGVCFGIDFNYTTSACYIHSVRSRVCPVPDANTLLDKPNVIHMVYCN